MKYSTVLYTFLDLSVFKEYDGSMSNPENKKLNDEIERLSKLGLGLREIARVKKLHPETVRRKLLLRSRKKSLSAIGHRKG